MTKCTCYRHPDQAYTVKIVDGKKICPRCGNEIEFKQFSGYSTETPNNDIGMLKLNRTKDIGGKHESNAIQGFRDSSTEMPKGDV